MSVGRLGGPPLHAPALKRASEKQWMVLNEL